RCCDQADNHPQHRPGGVQADRRRVRRLAADPLQPEIAAGERIGGAGRAGQRALRQPRDPRGGTPRKALGLRRSSMSNQAESKFVYVTYIRTTPEKLWEALTSREFMAQYWLGNQPEAEWRVGGSWKI